MSFALFGRDLFGDEIRQHASGPLAERFTLPPFSVLNAREGAWQERKRAWVGLGIQSELGRGACPGGSPMPADRNKDRAYGTGRAACPAWMDEKAGGTRGESSGTSIFDPTLCELMYSWFCPLGGQIVDPFAGGSVRGIVAGLMGYSYHGIDLSQQQIEANRQQKAVIAPEASVVWEQGDSLDRLADAPAADFIFSCPPYGDLERYSDDPRDLSTMEYHTFLANYKRIILRCRGRLKPDRLACFVVSDFRDRRTGYYRGFVADTINAFREIGLQLYNDAVLVTAAGSLPLRTSSQFFKSRKLGKTHQNILVFTNGDPRKICATGALAAWPAWEPPAQIEERPWL